MPINLNLGGQRSGLKNVLGIVAGILTGGAAGAALGVGSTAGAITGGAAGANPNSPLGQAVNLYGTVDKIGTGLSSSDGVGSSTPQTDQAMPGPPKLGSQFEGKSPSISASSPVDRAVIAQQQNPAYQIKNAMNTVMNTPAGQLGMTPELHADIFHILSRAHHFGPGGGMDQSGNGQMDMGGYA